MDRYSWTGREISDQQYGEIQKAVPVYSGEKTDGGDSSSEPESGKGSHIAVDKVKIAAILGRDAVHILQFPDVVGAHPAVLPCRSIAVHAAGIIPSEQTFHIELGKILFLFLCGKERPLDGLLPAHQPGLQRVFHELQRLLLNIGEL